ncbi:MAG TPA: carboxypeptidase-like regulatory domain-containing protein, partial [Bacteroidales bacterium]|nr:carboxypeptidase-like regulatory domain-containing protein [Bacteroidales bacterium]
MVRSLLLIFIFFQSFFLHSQIIKGELKDESGSPLPGAAIFIKNSKSVAISDRNGYYQISLKPGKQTLIIKMMGYQTIEKNIDVSLNSKIKFDTMLNVNAKVLSEAVISSDKRSLAKSIIQEMKDKRKDYLDSIQNYECTIYRKISLENTEPKMMKDSVEKNRNDSISGLAE